MPTTRDFQKKYGHQKKAAHYDVDEPTEKPSRAKRRPGREDVEEPTPAKAKKVKAEAPVEEHDEEFETEHENIEELEADAEAPAHEDRIEIQFRGSELLRARFPKSFELAEEVATQWIHGGDFENLPISHPLGQWAAQRGLLKAKSLEQKVVESPLFEKAAIQILTAGMKAQGFLQKLRAR